MSTEPMGRIISDASSVAVHGHDNARKNKFATQFDRMHIRKPAPLPSTITIVQKDHLTHTLFIPLIQEALKAHLLALL